MKNPLDGYIFKKMKKISGWLSFTDARLIKLLLEAQDKNKNLSSVVEIGVHQGKSLLLFCLASRNAKIYAIDLFDMQEKNIDLSGKGNLDKLYQNLKNFDIDVGRIFIDKRESSMVLPADIVLKVGRPSFFHIDGGHHFECVLNDLRLAVSSLSDPGVIALDDVFRPEWPEVSAGLFSFLGAEAPHFRIFAIGFNKTFICQRQYVNAYQEAIKSDCFLELFFSREYLANGDRIIVFQEYPLPEWGLRRVVYHQLKLRFPRFFRQIRSIFWKNRI